MRRLDTLSRNESLRPRKDIVRSFMTIKVFFVDSRTGKTFAQSSMPPELLPEAFEPDTVFKLAGQNLHVLKAEPLTSKEFIRTGKLIMTLEKIKMMPTEGLLFKFPTICDMTPARAEGTSKRGRNVFEMHEDEWRQIEFISSGHLPAINSQFAEIAQIVKDKSVDNGKLLGFREIYIRKEIAVPIQNRIPFSEVLATFPEAQSRYEGVAYLLSDGLIEGGFAFRLGSLIVYGQESEGLVKVLGLQHTSLKGDHRKADAAGFEKVLSNKELYLIDWCKVRGMGAETDALIRKFIQHM